MKRTSLILIMVASAAAAIAQTSTSPAPAATPAAAPSATATSAAAPAAKPATTAAADAKPAETKPEPPKRPADVDDEGNPIYHPEAPPLVADIHCGETSKTCTINLPPGIPPTDAKLVDDFSLRYQDIKIGTGAEALPGRKYTLHYTGWNAASGSKFDSTYDHHANLKDKDGKPVMGDDGKPKQDPAPQPFTFKWDDHKVIPGLEQGILGMKIGGKRRIIIPYQMAYGVYGRRGPNAAHPGVTPKSDIIFDVELLDVSDQYATPKPAPKPDEKKPETKQTAPAAPKAAAPAATPASTAAPAASATPASSAQPK
jgi:peptidylprolyl isomerase